MLAFRQVCQAFSSALPAAQSRAVVGGSSTRIHTVSMFSTSKMQCGRNKTIQLQQPCYLNSTMATTRAYSSVNTALLAERVERVLDAKKQSKLSYDELAEKMGTTNTYAAQVLMGQAKITQATAQKLQAAISAVSEADLLAMQEDFPMRSYDDAILKEPNVYRTYEAITHYGEAIKTIINEQCGDGIMSAIDFYCDVGTTTGKHGEKRVVITFNGKFLPFIEQSTEDNGAKSPRE